MVCRIYNEFFLLSLVPQCYYIVYAVHSREPCETTSIVSTALDTHNTAITNSAEENGAGGGKEKAQRKFVHSSGVDIDFVGGDGEGGLHVTLLQRKVGCV